MALELDDYNNAARWEPFRSACHSFGLLAGCWFTDGQNMGLTPLDADFTIAEVESESDRQGAINAAPYLPDIPRAILTNFTPMTDAQGVPVPENAAPLIAAGYECLTEAYMGVNPNASPERLDFRATQQLGWHRSAPVFGVYDKDYDFYDQYRDQWPGWGDYTAEYVDL